MIKLDALVISLLKINPDELEKSIEEYEKNFLVDISKNVFERAVEFIISGVGNKTYIYGYTHLFFYLTFTRSADTAETNILLKNLIPFFVTYNILKVFIIKDLNDVIIGYAFGILNSKIKKYFLKYEDEYWDEKDYSFEPLK